MEQDNIYLCQACETTFLEPNIAKQCPICDSEDIIWIDFDDGIY